MKISRDGMKAIKYALKTSVSRYASIDEKCKWGADKPSEWEVSPNGVSGLTPADAMEYAQEIMMASRLAAKLNGLELEVDQYKESPVETYEEFESLVNRLTLRFKYVAFHKSNALSQYEFEDL